ncbi:MAG: NAD-dependent epimerase/dehydratase family protein [Candidatus Omnitrophica bacterium]|nr:NAD-dependent epimerase/dehydratase family protein [Candidatus Omnitrophota bacterium]
MKEMSDILNGKNVLVTGGAGAIGSNLVSFLENHRCHVIVIDDLSAGLKSNFPKSKNVRFYKGSILSDTILNKVFKGKIDYVFHLAAHFANQNSIDHPCEDMLTNALGTLKMLQYANGHKVKRFVYASSSCVYGSVNEVMSEDLIAKLETPYAISKLTGEEYVYFFRRHYDMNNTVVRYFNAYGPGDPPGKYRNVIPNFFMLALNKRPLVVTGTGEETRDFTYMDDVVKGTVQVLGSDITIGNTYNIGSGKEVRIIDLANLINKITKNPAGVQFASMRSWDGIKRRLSDISKSRLHIGYEPKVAIEDGLELTWRWFKERYKKINA